MYSAFNNIFDHRSARSSPELMSLLNDPESTVQKNIKMQKASFRTTYTDADHTHEDTSSYVKILSREGGEDENDGIQLKLEQRESLTMAKREQQVNNVVLSYTEF